MTHIRDRWPWVSNVKCKCNVQVLRNQYEIHWIKKNMWCRGIVLGNYKQAWSRSRGFIYCGFISCQSTSTGWNTQNSVGPLRSVDMTMCTAVRRFIHLPQETYIPMFHEKISKEGFYIPEHESAITNHLVDSQNSLLRSSQ